LTVFGAPLASRATTIFPHDVSIVAVYVLLVSMVIGGGAVNFGRLGLSGGLVSLHWMAARAGLAVVVVAGAVEAVVEVALAFLVFLELPLLCSQAQRANRAMTRTKPTTPRIIDFRFRSCLAASN